MPYEILFTEIFGSDGSEIVYVKPPESNRVSRLDSSLRRGGNVTIKIWNVFKEIFLPRGYPESVSSDYSEYQLWDTLQAFSSTISHTLTTHAILVGVGVGNVEASALGAAVTWIFKDGVGMVSKILFAWLSGCGFDSDCKKWRLLADVLNDLAMLFELTLLPLLPSYSLQILCISSSLKAIVGVAGGATRAAVTQHQAISENTGDVSAKDSSQETCVNLVASVFGVFILSHISDTFLVYPLFFFITFLHLYSNYKAVKALKFKVFNPERYHLVLYHYLTGNYILTPDVIAEMESVSIFSGFTDQKLSGYRVKVGSSLRGLSLTSNQLRMISSLYKDRNFMLVQTTLYVRAVLSKSIDVKDLFEAYFHSLILALASSYSVSNLPESFEESAETENTPFQRLLTVLHKMNTRKPTQLLNIEELIELDQYCIEEFKLFWSGLNSAGWNLDSHQFHRVDVGWRACWGSRLPKSQPYSSFKLHDY